MKSLEKEELQVIDISNKYYPNNFRFLEDMPRKIYCKGNIKLLNAKKKLAIIGSRECSEYGRNISYKISYELAKRGITIISGAARGIDSFANRGALRANKETIAVLGNGLNYIYPSENKYLEEQILENNGLLISEYKIGTKPSKLTFPARNRLISALSEGILIVEAKEKSGTFITVDFALEQGKNVYAIPGDITRKNSKGTNELIKQGAKVVTNLKDVLEDFV